MSVFYRTLVTAFTGCNKDNDGGLSLPGAAGDVSAVKKLDGRAPVTEKEAIDLLESAISEVYDTLSSLNSQVYDKAFRRQVGVDPEAWLISKFSETKVSLSLQFTDADNKFSDPAYNKVRITGNSDSSISSNRKLGELYSSTYTPKAGDNISSSSSFKKTADFKDTEITINYDPSYKVCGIIKAESNESGSGTVKVAGTTTSNTKIEQSESGTEKVSAVLSVSDGSISAKFKFSYASEGSGSKRQITENGNEGSILSDLEVFSSDNKLLWTITYWESGDVYSLISALDDSLLGSDF